MTTDSFVSVIRGVVADTDEQLHSVRVNTQTGHGRVNATPVIWIREESGKERRFEGDLFAGACVGHEVAVVGRRGTNTPLAFANFTTEKVRDADELRLYGTANATFFDSLLFSFLLALLGLAVWAALLSVVGLAEHAVSSPGAQIYILLFAACAYPFVNRNILERRDRIKALRDEIDRLLIQARVVSET